MLDGTSVLWVYLPLTGTSYSQCSRFVMGVKIKVTGDSELNDSPAAVNTVGREGGGQSIDALLLAHSISQ